MENQRSGGGELFPVLSAVCAVCILGALLLGAHACLGEYESEGWHNPSGRPYASVPDPPRLTSRGRSEVYAAIILGFLGVGGMILSLPPRHRRQG